MGPLLAIEDRWKVGCKRRRFEQIMPMIKPEDASAKARIEAISIGSRRHLVHGEIARHLSVMYYPAAEDQAHQFGGVHCIQTQCIATGADRFPVMCSR